MKLSLSLENYLETIFDLSENNKGVRITDLASKMEVSKASANKAVNNLASLGLITNEKYQLIFLTPKGLDVSHSFLEKHKTIQRYLILSLNIDEALADIEACKIEHIISDELFNSMKKYIAKKK